MIDSKEREKYLDIAKGIGIVLVVIGHCPRDYNPLTQWIYTFHMPLFFVVSGMVWNKVSHEKRGFFNKRFILDKLRRLIIPCYIWGMFYMILNAVVHHSFSAVNIAYLIYGSQSGFSHADSLTSLWFFTCMFLAVCMFEIVQEKVSGQKNAKKILIVLSIVCAVLGLFIPRIPGGYPWCLDISFLAAALMIWGYLGKNYFKKIDKSTVLCLIAVISAAVLTLTFRINLRYVSINNVDMAHSCFGNPGLYLVDAAAGCICVLAVSRLLSNTKASLLLCRLGRHTIPILLIHKLVIRILERVLINKVSGILATCIEVVIAIAISEVFYCMTVKHMPILFGERRHLPQMTCN